MMFSFFKEWHEAYDMRHEPESAHRLGDLSWHFVVTTAGIGCATVVGYGLWLFLVPPTVVETTTPAAVVQSFNRDELVRVVKQLETRANAFRERVIVR